MIRVIVEGKKRTHAYRFTCLECGSVLEATQEELKQEGFFRNTQYYSCWCPVCMEESVVAETDLQEVDDGT